MDELTDLELQSAEMSLNSISVKLRERLDFLNKRGTLATNDQEKVFLYCEVTGISSKLNSTLETARWISREIGLRKSEVDQEYCEVIDRLKILCGDYEECDCDECLENQKNSEESKNLEIE